MAGRDESAVTCTACDGTASDCPWCGETGVMNPRQRRRFEHFEMVRTSGTHELFRKSSDELAVRLHQFGTAEAMRLAEEATRFAATFAAWRKSAPTSHVRKQTIDALFDFQRRALDYMTSGMRTSS